MYDKEEAFLLWFPANSVSMRVGNAHFYWLFLPEIFDWEIRTDQDYRVFNEFSFIH